MKKRIGLAFMLLSGVSTSLIHGAESEYAPVSEPEKARMVQQRREKFEKGLQQSAKARERKERIESALVGLQTGFETAKKETGALIKKGTEAIKTGAGIAGRAATKVKQEGLPGAQRIAQQAGETLKEIGVATYQAAKRLGEQAVKKGKELYKKATGSKKPKEKEKPKPKGSKPPKRADQGAKRKR